jgi:hypothetical protein
MPEREYAIRRRHRRVEARLPLRISTIEPELDPWTGRPFFRASHETCANVSRGGLLLRTYEPIDQGRRLLLELQLPGELPVEAIGRVAWSKKVLAPGTLQVEAEMGVEFLGGSGEQLSRLADFVELSAGGAAGEPSSAGAAEPGHPAAPPHPRAPKSP